MIAIRISVFHLDFQSGAKLIADEADSLAVGVDLHFVITRGRE
jgi:hypothetical protein